MLRVVKIAPVVKISFQSENIQFAWAGMFSGEEKDNKIISHYISEFESQDDLE